MGIINILDLPAELLFMITEYLHSFSDLVQLAKTCTRFKSVCETATKRALKRLQDLANAKRSKSAFPAAQLILVLFILYLFQY